MSCKSIGNVPAFTTFHTGVLCLLEFIYFCTKAPSFLNRTHSSALQYMLHQATFSKPSTEHQTDLICPYSKCNFCIKTHFLLYFGSCNYLSLIFYREQERAQVTSLHVSLLYFNRFSFLYNFSSRIGHLLNNILFFKSYQ